ncbi:MAG: tetratricopeptide repeat protein [Terriglobia bacterium]
MSQFPNPDHAGERASFRQNSRDTLKWSLRPWWRVAVFLIPIVAGSAWLSYKAILVAHVSYQVNTVSIPDIQKAISQDPDNADLIHNLGVVYASSPTDSNASESVKILRKALALNPRRWDYWADLGKSCDFAGDTACSDRAFDRALALNPMAPSMQWAQGNHFLLTNRAEKAFPYFRRLLKMDSTYFEPTLRLCMRATRDPQIIYAEVIPHDAGDAAGRFNFLMFLTSISDYENAMGIWGQMISGPDRSPDLSMVKPFLDFLIDQNRIQDASAVWTDLQHAGAIPPGPSAASTSLLYHGAFEEPLLNAGFDWRISDSADLEFDFADPSAYKGAKCLRIEFALGRNADYDLLSQVVLTKPGTRYQLLSYVRSYNLTSESGPRWRVTELGCEGCGTQTSDSTVGTTSWHPVEVGFTTHPQTQAVRISFWRPPDQTYHRDITGTVWLDGVTLRAAEPPAGSPVSDVAPGFSPAGAALKGGATFTAHAALAVGATPEFGQRPIPEPAARQARDR